MLAVSAHGQRTNTAERQQKRMDKCHVAPEAKA